MDKRMENIKIFKDTFNKCTTNETLRRSVNSSTENQRIILEGDILPVRETQKEYKHPANVIVSRKRSLEAASCYREKKVCVHNFASASNPGGGVKHGAFAQEECLCRVSGLYGSLTSPEAYSKFYGPHREHRNFLHNDDLIYTPDVVVFKTDDDHPVMMGEEEWYRVDIITMAAPNLNNGGRWVPEEELLKIHEKRLCRLLEVARYNGEEVVILGAFGCGAFGNPPQIVAQAARKALQKYTSDFETIEFAIYCHSDDLNYRIFRDVIGNDSGN